MGATECDIVDETVPILNYALALFSGVLLALSFPRYGHPAVAWVALVPLLVALSGWRAQGQPTGQPRQRADDFAWHQRLVRDDHLRARTARSNLLWRRAVVDLASAQRLQGIPAQVTGIQCVAVEDNEFHAGMVTP